MRIFKFDTLQSTNSYLKDHISEHINHDVVFTFNQTNGHGRTNRTWSSNKDSLTFSILFKDEFLYENYQSLSLISAVAVFKVLQKRVPNLKIKWPNDLIINDKKICGILLESRISSHMEGLILGIGININNESFPSNLNATSLYLETSKKEDIKSILFEVLESILLHIDNLKSGKSDHINIINEYNYLYLKNAYAVINDKKVLVKVLNILGNNHLQVQYNNDIIEVSTDEISFHKD